MKKIYLFLPLVALYCMSATNTTEYAVTFLKTGELATESRKEIEGLNNKIETLYQKKDQDALTGLYVKDLTFFAEYKPGIFDTKKLNTFLKDWFKAGDIKTYKKSIYAVESYSDHLLEIGSFNMTYSSNHTRDGVYAGKYMVMWRRDGRGNLKIVSETFGAHKHIEPEDMPYADVQSEENDFIEKLPASKKIQKEVEAFDAIVLKAVAEGDGNARANGFTNDAIVLSAFDSMRVGMEKIRPKMLKTYTKDVSFIVEHTYQRIYDLGDYIFVNGHYKGGWGDPANGGRFDGNMSSLMKRMENGKLLMHRQAGNRDRKLIEFKD